MKKKKIGIMGGTFNPIHNGHLLLAESAYYQFGLDEVLIMPTKNTYYKRTPHGVTEDDRVNMIELAIKDNSNFVLSKEELKREGTTYTVDTLEHLTERHSDYMFYFIMGADSLYHIESWREPERIFELARIVVAGRGGSGSSSLESQIEYLEDKFNARISKLDAPMLDISSNDIRRRVIHGQSIRYLLPDSVRDYIINHNIYL